MRIVIMATGTRGDVQPMIAIGIALHQAGHQVRLIAGSNFVASIEAYGLEVFPTFDMTDLMQSEVGIKWVESSNGYTQLRAMKALTNSLLERTVADTINGTRGAELLLGGFIAEPYLQAISEKHGTPLISVALQPYRTTHSGAASLLPLRPRSNSILNRWSGHLAQRLTWSVAEQTTNALRAQLDLPPQTARSYLRTAQTIPTLYAISRHVVPPVIDTGAYTTGYWFLEEAEQLSDDLRRFLAAGPAPVYIGFGSMSGSNPSHTVTIVGAALQQVGQRGVLTRGWSGAESIDTPPHLFLLESVAHSWLFPQMAAVVHHGGAGTTAAGLRAGKPTLVVPHMADQPYWGRRVQELGVGVKPLPRAKLTVDLLARSIDTLVTDSSIQARAAALGRQIEAEQGIEQAMAWINAFIAR